MIIPFAFWKSSLVVFNPAALGAMKLWLKADAGITLNGSTVSKWDDYSGNSNHAVMATAVYQPAFVANGINGKPSLRFDAAMPSYMDLTYLIGNNAVDSFTVFVVMKRRVNTDQGYLGYNGGGTYFLQQSSAWWVHNNTKAAPMTNGVWYLRTNLVNNTAPLVTYISNSTSLGTVAGSSLIAINKIGFGHAWGLDGELAEIMVYQKILTAGEQITVNDYLNAKYAIY